MTYKTKNATFVFAFVAMLMVAPLAGQQANAEVVDANVNAVCGFTTSGVTLNIGSFNKADAATALTAPSGEFANGAGTNGEGRFLVTLGDWFGTGTRAVGTITLVGAAVDAGETVTVGANTYTAIASATTDVTFDNRGTDIQDAQELAKAIRDKDPLFRTSNGGTNVVTINVVLRGSDGNSATLTEVGDDYTVVGFSGGSVTPQQIMDGEITKFAFTDEGTAVTTTYASMLTPAAVATALEVLGSTSSTQPIKWSFGIDPANAVYTNLPYDGPLTQAITFGVECDGT